MTDQAQARPGHEHVTAVREHLQRQRWAGIEWWQATDTDDEGLHRRRGASNPASVIADVLEAAAELELLAPGDTTRGVLAQLTYDGQRCLQHHAEPGNPVAAAEHRQELATALLAAQKLLGADRAGVGSDQDAPSAPQERPQAAAQADPVAQYPPTPENRSEAVPDTVPTLLPGDLDNAPPIVRMAGRDAANAGANAGLGTTIEEAIDAAITATWAGAHQHLAGHCRDQGRQQAAGALAYETTCLRCVDQLDQLAAERAAGIAEGITGARDAAAELVADAAFDWTGETQRTIQAIAGRVRDMRLEAHDADEPMRIAGYQPDPATLQRSQEAISAVLDLCATADEHRSEAGPYAALYEWAPKVRAEIATHLGKTPAAMPLPAATRVALAQLVAAVEHHLATDADDTLSAGYRRGARDGLDCRIREARQALGRGAN
jgi:hypothetical protein